MEEENSCCYKRKERSEKEYKDLMNRLNRIEGQVRGIKGMVEKDVYCFARDIREGKKATLDEVVVVLQRLMT